VWGISFFVFPALLVFSGLMLTSYGLRLKNMPPLHILIMQFFNRMR
jgi:hypothetical protein